MEGKHAKQILLSDGPSLIFYRVWGNFNNFLNLICVICKIEILVPACFIIIKIKL